MESMVLTRSQVQRRRSERTHWRIPCIITWQREKTLTVREQVETEVINAHGALIRLSTRLPVGDIIKIMRLGAGPTGSPSKLARVVNDLGQDSNGKVSLGVELDTPSLEFWVALAR